MKKVFITVLIIWLGIALIAPKYIGLQVESGFKAYLQSNDIISLQRYGITISLKQYNRGYFSSTAKVAFTIENQMNGDLLLESELNYDIKHAPFSLSGFNLVDIDSRNMNNLAGEWRDALPEDFLTACIQVNLLGRVVENIELSPFSASLSPITSPIKHIDFGGADIHWYSHIQDFAFNGHGFLNSPFIELEDHANQIWRIDELSGQLHMLDGEQTLSIPSITLSLQRRGEQILNIYAQGIEQVQAFLPFEKGYLPLSRELTINRVDIDINKVPQAQITTIHGKAGLQKGDSDYEFTLNWQGHLTLDENFDKEKLPLFAVMPTQQDISFTVSPINHEQLLLWSLIIESFWQPNTPMIQAMNDFGRLLRLDIAKEQMKLSLQATLTDQDQLLATTDIMIDENINNAQQINLLFNHGLNPHWFNNSHANIRVNQVLLRRLKLMPYLILLADKGIQIEDDDYVSMHAKIIDQQLFINDEMRQ